MKLKIVPKLLYEHLRHLRPVHSHHFPDMAISTNGKSVYFRVCDSVIFGQVVLPYSEASIQVIDPGPAMIPAHFFIDLLERLEYPLVLEWERQVGSLSSSQEGTFTFTSQQTNSFPSVPPEQNITPLSLDVADVRFLVERLVPVVLQDRNRNPHRDISIICDSTGMRWEANDGYQLAHIRLKQNFPDPMSYSVPAHFFQIVSRALPRTGEVSLALGKQNIYFGFSRIVFQCGISTRVDNYNFHTQQAPYRLSVSQEAIHKTLDCLSLVTDRDVSAPVVCSVWGSEVSFDLHTNQSRRGLHTLTCEYEGPPMKFALNLDQLLRAVNLATGDRIFIDLLSPSQFVTIHCDEHYIHRRYLMPMNLKITQNIAA